MYTKFMTIKLISCRKSEITWRKEIF